MRANRIMANLRVADIGAAKSFYYAEAQQRGFKIIRPLTAADWGVRRFLVRSPDGNVINIVNYRD